MKILEKDFVKPILTYLKENEVLLGGYFYNGKKRYTQFYKFSTYVNPDGTKSIDCGYLHNKFARISSFKKYTGKNDVWITKSSLIDDTEPNFFLEIAAKIS